MTALAIIPARGGSKRIPRKNIKEFLGVPMIAYGIRAAMDSGCFDEIMVSTDDPEIERTARAHGAAVPFPRSERASDDHATLSDVVSEVLATYAERGSVFDEFCCILPTCPLLDSRDLRAAKGVLADAPGVFSGVRFGYPIWRALQVRDGEVSMIWPEHLRTRSQDLPPAFHDAGMFYWCRTADFLEQRNLFLPGARLWELPAERVQDIDTPDDWRLAELKHAMLRIPPLQTGDAK